MTTRRTSRRSFFLRPSREVNQIVMYSLGVALQRHPGVKLHAGMVLSNHKHECYTDAAPSSQLAAFKRDYHTLLARALNARLGRGEALWCAGSYGNVEVHDLPTLEDQLLYLWANAVLDGLVARPEDWPGVKFLPADFGRTFVVQKPEGAFFGGRRPEGLEPTDPHARRAWLYALRRREQEERRRQNERDRRRGRGRRRRGQLRRGRLREKERAPRPARADRSTLPEVVRFKVHPPPGHDRVPLEEIRAYYQTRLDDYVAQAHREREEQGLNGFLGVEAILAQNPFESAGDTFPSFARNPTIACLDPGQRQARVAELQEWRYDYRSAREAWCQGRRDVLFPHGSYWLPHFHGARTRRATGPPAFA